MSSPSLGNTPPGLPTSVSSALDVSQSSVRRRVSGPHSIPSLYVTPVATEGVNEGERCANPFDSAQGGVQQQKLPALGRELFSDDEDGEETTMPPPGPSARNLDTRPLPQVPADAPDSCCPPSYGETVARLPTPNFAAVHDDVQRAHDLDTRLGLFFKLTQPFRILKGRPKSGDGASGALDNESNRPDNPTGAGAPEQYAARTRDLPHSNSTTQQPLQAASSLSRRDTATSGGTFVTAVSGPADADAVRLIANEAEPLSRRTTKSIRFLDVPEQDDIDEDAVSEGGSSSEGLLHRQPHSPALLAATHAATDRFTRRFPISLSHRKANRGVTGRDGDPEDQNLLPLLGYGETGAVVERPNVWTPEKWALLFSVCSVFTYGLTALILVLMTWFGVWQKSAVMRIVDYDILVTITSASLIVFGTSLFGICGTLLNSRPLLAIYCVLLWPSFAAMLVIGYTAYRRAAFALPSKIDQAWSQKYGDEDRMILQYSLRCCGYWSPEHSASPSPMCFPRSPLPGCKSRLLRFERASLSRYYTWVFALVPLHILNIVTALLCSNHVNRLFGKGLTPWKYRLSIADVRANALRVLETYRDTLIPPEPGRVYALRSRRLGDGTSRSPMIPQGEADRSPRPERDIASIQPVSGNDQVQGHYQWIGGMSHTASDGSMFGFRRRTDGERMG